MNIKKLLGKRIKELRKNKGITQEAQKIIRKKNKRT